MYSGVLAFAQASFGALMSSQKHDRDTTDLLLTAKNEKMIINISINQQLTALKQDER